LHQISTASSLLPQSRTICSKTSSHNPGNNENEAPKVLSW
jgi:hypothetical protein